MPAHNFSTIGAIRIAIGVLACTLAILLEWQRPEFLVRIDEGVRDAFIQFTADQEPEDRLVVIDIDETTLEKIGPWPWPRQRMADLVEILFGSYGARAVALDIVFPEPGDMEGDARLAALAVHAPLTLVQIFDYTLRSPEIRQGTIAGGLAASSNTGVLTAYGYIANHAGLASARCIGNIGYLPDIDGVLRHTPVQTRFEGKDYPHLASALIDCAGRDERKDISTKPPASMSLSNENGLWRVPFRRSLSAYNVIPAIAILDESAPHSLISNRYVLVGSSSLGLGDRVSTPLAPLTSGVMVHAASLSGLLDIAEGNARPTLVGTPLANSVVLVEYRSQRRLHRKATCLGGAFIIVQRRCRLAGSGTFRHFAPSGMVGDSTALGLFFVAFDRHSSRMVADAAQKPTLARDLFSLCCPTGTR
ncbi:MAG: CHASE2 domain-containing protein [Betaproteobacteria bacterium]|nr:CHASE2 domain-containing protein [Betaproteobacteria bacterium]